MHVYNYYQLFACLLTSMLYQYTPVQALLWPGGAIWLHALSHKTPLNKIFTSQLHLHLQEDSSRNTLILKESNNDPTITQPGV